MTNKKKIIIGLQVVATVYLLGNMLYNNLQAFDLMSTAMGLLGLFGNILLAHKKKETFALNMTNNVLGGVLSFQNRFFAEVGMNVIYFESQEKAQQAIQSVGEERVKKYIFGVED